MSDFDKERLGPETPDFYQALAEQEAASISEFEAGKRSERLIQAIIDTRTSPYLDSERREGEAILTPTYSPADYVTDAHIHSYRPKSKSGHRPKHYPKDVGLTKLLRHERVVLANTIFRLGGKYYDMHVSAERMAHELNLEETESDTSEIVEARAHRFMDMATSGDEQFTLPLTYLRGFSRVNLSEQDADTVAAFLDESMKIGNPIWIDAVAKSVFAHELKRALFFQGMHDRFANYYLERMDFWERNGIPDLQTITRDIDISSKAMSPKVIETVLSMSEEDIDLAVKPLEIPENSFEQHPTSRGVVRDIIGKIAVASTRMTSGGIVGNRLEYYWRESLHKLKQMGRTGLAIWRSNGDDKH